MHILVSFVFGIGLGIVLVTARNVTFDNTSPLVVFSPTPCFQQDTPDCSPEWLFSETADAFNGSTTSTTGPDPALGLDVLPRVSLTFQGSSVIFMPGLHSSAQASVIVDDLASILLDTAQSAFSGTGLDPSRNHTITITFVPSENTTTLDVDYFLVDQLDVNTTSSSTSSFFPTPLPTTLPSNTSSLASISSSHTHKHPPTTTSLRQSPGVPTGTIAAVSLSGALVLFLAALTWLLTARRRRRRAALQREKAILYDLRLPSERSVKDRATSRVRRWEDEQRERERHREQPWEDAPRREKGKGREISWRDSILPPVHYTPWR